MQVTVLYDNAPGTDTALTHGHGLSLYLETRDDTILFDFGRDAGFIDNADRLGVDLGRADFAVLSHGHNDHGGGLHAFQERFGNIPVYARATAFLPHSSFRNGRTVDLTVPQPGIPIQTTAHVHPIHKDLLLFSLPLEKAPDQTLLETDENGSTAPDLFFHEQHLLLQEGDRCHLITGCAHAGIEQIMEAAETIIGRPLSSVIGGLHYYTDLTPDRILSAAERFIKHSVMVVTGHCTGNQACDHLSAAGVRLFPMKVGQTFEV